MATIPARMNGRTGRMSDLVMVDENIDISRQSVVARAWAAVRRLARMPGRRFDAFLNRGLSTERHIRLNIAWPLWPLPFYLFSQLVTPHPVWLTLLVTTVGIYGLGYLWVREQAQHVILERRRRGAILVAGDSFQEEFHLRNDSRLPVLWAEFDDESELPGYDPSQVVAAGAHSFYRWRTQVECRRRGVYRIGPFRLAMADPLNLFSVELRFPRSETLVIYPRVLQLPRLQLPRGNAGGTDRQRRPLQGNLPAASVREYQWGDSVRHIHWPTTAHRGALTIKELELEPSGDVWIALNLNQTVQRGTGETSTLEYGIVVAASLAADLLGAGERRAVGLLAASGVDEAAHRGSSQDAPVQTIVMPPLSGQAQLWSILAALAPVEPGPAPLADLLRSSRSVLGRRRSLVVITPLPDQESSPELDRWLAELSYFQGMGLAIGVLLLAPEDTDPAGADQMRGLLAGFGVPAQVLHVGEALPPLLTYRRTRTELRTTPTGGVVAYEVEEEVG